MKMKKTAALILAGTMAFSMSACGGGSQGNSGNSAQGSAGGSSVTVAIWDNAQLPGLKEIMGDFTKESGISVDIQVVPWDQYWTLLEAGAQGGDMPDVFWMHSNYSQKFMSNDILLDLTDRIAGSEVINLDNYYKDITELYQLDGKTYAIPKDYDTIGLWYNKEMFDAAGISYPDETWTWETMAEAAEKLTNKEKGQYGFASPAANNQDGYYNLIYTMGGSILNEDKTKSNWDSPETIAAMQWWMDNLVTKSMPTQEVMAESAADVLLSSGKAAMIMQGSWMVAAFKGNEYTDEHCDVAVLLWQRTEPERLFTMDLAGQLVPKARMWRNPGSFWNTWAAKQHRKNRQNSELPCQPIWELQIPGLTVRQNSIYRHIWI